MPYTIFVTPTALDDITIAIDYYNAVSVDLGYRFADQVANYFYRISSLPTAPADDRFCTITVSKPNIMVSRRA